MPVVSPARCLPGPSRLLQGDVQGPHSVEQFQKWMTFLSSSKNNDDHKLAYEQFRDVSVWRRGMDCRVPLTLLLDAAARK
ncbi:hypothetical protein COHA_003216 [Chlorella ohadii]|uniref:Uncharacterized protein n=1 Tax=Chlorella ohadii TaxID=2649997 RepID=A0AAD5DSU2_9CHLO|nr:hypothetical protein COHA_003216 [Chlorella ohadii]